MRKILVAALAAVMAMSALPAFGHEVPEDRRWGTADDGTRTAPAGPVTRPFYHDGHVERNCPEAAGPNDPMSHFHRFKSDTVSDSGLCNEWRNPPTRTSRPDEIRTGYRWARTVNGVIDAISTHSANTAEGRTAAERALRFDSEDGRQAVKRLYFRCDTGFLGLDASGGSACQYSDGGWGWVPTSPTRLDITAYQALGGRRTIS